MKSSMQIQDRHLHLLQSILCRQVSGRETLPAAKELCHPESADRQHAINAKQKHEKLHSTNLAILTSAPLEINA